MIQPKFITSIILLTRLFACEPTVTFNEPQPSSTDNLSKFPDRLQGQYSSLADSSTYVINDKLIQRICDFDYKIHPSQLDSNSRLSGDTIINLTTKTKEVIKRDGDSLVTHTHYIDTLFQLDYDNVIRKFKGYYFINKRYDKKSWEVKKIQVLKGQLVLSSITDKQDIENLRAITESRSDTVAPYQFAITKKQFKEYINNNGFTANDTLVRQTKNLQMPTKGSASPEVK